MSLILLAAGNLYGQSGDAPLLSDLDIPLMPGFQEEGGSRLVFDTPEGRIVEVQATGPHSTAKVIDYYNIVLPSLSWVVTTGTLEGCKPLPATCIIVRREEEVLTVKIREIKGVKAKTMIYFSLNPE